MSSPSLTNELFELTNELSELTNELSEFTNELSEFTNELSEFTNELFEFTNELFEFTNELSEFTNELFEFVQWPVSASLSSNQDNNKIDRVGSRGLTLPSTGARKTSASSRTHGRGSAACRAASRDWGRRRRGRGCPAGERAVRSDRRPQAGRSRSRHLRN